jgi:(p)ppGpp synthase/HD superfamily hydrolase
VDLSTRFEEALLYAAQLHAGQTRKGTDIPYISHLLGVTSLVLQYGGDEEQAIAALLHDGPEEAGGRATLGEIHRRFGDRVADIVEGCTDSWTTPKPPWRERKEAYVAHMRTAPAEELLVSAADKLHNVRTIVSDYRIVGESVWSRFTGGKWGTLWYYRALAEVLQARFPSPPVEELDRVVTQLESLVTQREPADGAQDE